MLLVIDNYDSRVIGRTRKHAHQRPLIVATERLGVQLVVLERLPRQREPGANERGHRLGEHADLVLRVRVEPQPEEVHQVVRVDFPHPLGIERHREHGPGELAGQSELVGETAVPRDVLVLPVREQVADDRGRFAGERLAAPLLVRGRLHRDLVGVGHVEELERLAVAQRHLVDVRGAVPDPLARDEDRHAAEELDLAHLERRRVPMPHQVAQERSIVLRGLGARPVAGAGGLHDVVVAAHVVERRHEAVVEHFDLAADHLFGDRGGGPSGQVHA